MELFRRRMSVLGSNHSNALKQQSTNIREATFTQHTGYMRVQVNGIEYDAHFTPSTEFSANKNEGSYFIEFRHGVEFPMGTYVWIPNEYKGLEPWLITSRPDNVLVKRVDIQKCNLLMKWQHEDSTDIIERWCVLRRPYSATLDSSDYMQYSIKEYRVFLPLDKDTRKLHVDHRLILEESNGVPLTYAITAFDTLSEAYSTTETLLSINVKQTASTESDNKDVGVADYIEPVVVRPTVCSILGDDSIKIGGTGTVFEAELDENICVEERPIWSIVASDGLEQQYEVDYLENGNICVRVVNNSKLIGEVFSIVASFPSVGLQSNKLVKVVGII